MRSWSACVIGGGVVGLTTALLAQERGAKVTLVADKFRKQTTSDGAAGIFRPATSFNVISPEITKELITFSYRYYEKLLEEDAGVKFISGYHLSNESPSNTRNFLLEGLVPEYREATAEEMAQFPGGWKWGSFYTTLLIENRFHLPWAEKKFVAQGGKIIRSTINDFSEVKNFGDFDLVFNCTGYGAKKLCNDLSMVALSGQIYKVEAPWCDKFLYGDEDTYLIPGYLLTVGGSRHFESYRTKPCPHDGAAIWSRARALMPQLQTSQIRRQWVGVRPYRSGGVRVQAEVINGMKVVHNYGHGGYGVTAAPGTAFYAVKLAEDFLSPNKL
uniref:D-aspartate oxidase n=1 Tax=Lygus hesperus TaxID=30085 RepID=A0A146KN86_LYGHE